MRATGLSRRPKLLLNLIDLDRARSMDGKADSCRCSIFEAASLAALSPPRVWARASGGSRTNSKPARKAMIFSIDPSHFFPIDLGIATRL
jgi:hypothetical protein